MQLFFYTYNYKYSLRVFLAKNIFTILRGEGGGEMTDSGMHGKLRPVACVVLSCCSVLRKIHILVHCRCCTWASSDFFYFE